MKQMPDPGAEQFLMRRIKEAEAGKHDALLELMERKRAMSPEEQASFSIVRELLKQAEGQASAPEKPAAAPKTSKGTAPEKSGVRASPKPLKTGGSLKDRAQQHPDFAKWEAKLADLESGDSEDALHPEHRAELTADVVAQLLKNEAMLYYLPRTVSSDVAGARNEGEHLQRAMTLADEVRQKYGETVDVRDAQSAFEDAEQEVGSWFSTKAGAVNEIAQRRLVQTRIEELKEENERLRSQLEEAA